MGIYLIDIFGNEVLVHSEAPGCFSAMPLAASPRPPVTPARRDFNNGSGLMYVADVYQGTPHAGRQTRGGEKTADRRVARKTRVDATASGSARGSRRRA